jgi:hypothetical protein
MSLSMITIKRLAAASWLALGLATLAACGGGGGAGGQGGTNTGAGGSSNATEMSVSTPTPTVGSDGLTTVTVNVAVKDAGQNALANQPVTVTTSDSGVTISGAMTRTDANGNFSKTVAVTDKVNRDVTLTVTSGTLVRQLTLQVVGSQLSINGPSTVAQGALASFTASLRDSGGNPVVGKTLTLSSTVGNTFNPSGTLTTNAAGQVNFTIPAPRPGADTITGTAGGASSTFSINVATSGLAFTSPAELQELDVNVTHSVSIQFANSTGSSVGQAMTFSSPRGDLDLVAAGNQSTLVATTGAGGVATVQIRSAEAGLTTLSVVGPGGITATRQVEFVSRNPGKIAVQASPAVVGVNLSSQSNNSSRVIATVLDLNDNPVKGAQVSFEQVADPSLGTIETLATTDSSGVAAVTFRPGPRSTGNNAVQIRATVVGTSINRSTFLTVSEQALYVRIGTGNSIVEPDSTKYRMPWTALVTDASGRGVANVTVSVTLTFINYRKGDWVPPALGVTSGGWNQQITATCASEDVNTNNRLDPTEDTNGNGRLDPGQVAAVTVLSTTNASGFADINIEYQQQFARWAEARLRATVTSLAGTEFFDVTDFWLPILASDVNDLSSSPPGDPSPFGVANSCTNPN